MKIIFLRVAFLCEILENSCSTESFSFQNIQIPKLFNQGVTARQVARFCHSTMSRNFCHLRKQVCVELELQRLAVNTMLKSSLVEELEGGMGMHGASDLGGTFVYFAGMRRKLYT